MQKLINAMEFMSITHQICAQVTWPGIALVKRRGGTILDWCASIVKAAVTWQGKKAILKTWQGKGSIPLKNTGIFMKFFLNRGFHPVSNLLFINLRIKNDLF